MAGKPARGMADVVAASTALSDIDGQAGRLSCRGYDIHDLARAATFEAVAYLLQHGSPPDRGELDSYRAEFTSGRGLAKRVASIVAGVAASQAPMEDTHCRMSRRMEECVLAEKHLYPTVDFCAATVYHYLGIPTGLFTPVFPVSRMAGWTAHVIEQHADNRLIRPDSEYTGERGQTWVPLEQR